jgi:DNA-binding transcriptional LysR family regulator
MLGRRIDALERRLGVKLMHRTTRHLTLTEARHALPRTLPQAAGRLDTPRRMVSEGRHAPPAT